MRDRIEKYLESIIETSRLALRNEREMDGLRSQLRLLVDVMPC